MDDHLAGDFLGDLGDVPEDSEFSKLGEEADPRDDDRFFDPPASAPKRMTSIAFCERCGCRLSQYRSPDDKLCCACNRAVNPLFDKSA